MRVLCPSLVVIYIVVPAPRPAPRRRRVQPRPTSVRRPCWPPSTSCSRWPSRATPSGAFIARGASSPTIRRSLPPPGQRALSFSSSSGKPIFRRLSADCKATSCWPTQRAQRLGDFLSFPFGSSSRRGGRRGEGGVGKKSGKPRRSSRITFRYNRSSISYSEHWKGVRRRVDVWIEGHVGGVE